MVGAADSHPHIKAVILPLSHRPTRAGTRLASYRVETQSSTCSSGDGHTAERCHHTGRDLRKVTDLSTPVLLQYCANVSNTWRSN